MTRVAAQIEKCCQVFSDYRLEVHAETCQARYLACEELDAQKQLVVSEHLLQFLG